MGAYKHRQKGENKISFRFSMSFCVQQKSMQVSVLFRAHTTAKLKAMALFKYCSLNKQTCVTLSCLVKSTLFSTQLERAAKIQHHVESAHFTFWIETKQKCRSNTHIQSILKYVNKHTRECNVYAHWSGIFASLSPSPSSQKAKCSKLLSQKDCSMTAESMPKHQHLQVWTNLTVILADTQSIAINARAAVRSRNSLQQQGTIIARTLTSPWHSTKSSTNSSIWSTNREHLLLPEGCAGSPWGALVDAGYTRSRPK